MSVPGIQLNDGSTIPQAGLGTWQVKDESELNEAFKVAIDAGYRHIDTAQAYDNEDFIGRAWKRAGLNRDEFFITTKIAVSNFGHGKAKRSFDGSLRNLQTDYVDLLLLHFPVTLLRKGSWQALEEIQSEGKAKSIGVSNYTIRHLEDMKQYAKVTPAVNQVELHVFLQQPELVKYCQDNGIVVEAYSPLARMEVTDNQIVQGLADKYGKTYAQIMLRWLVQLGCVVIPKSVTPERIKQNVELFDFEFTSDEMAEIARQDRDLRTCWSPVHVP